MKTIGKELERLTLHWNDESLRRRVFVYDGRPHYLNLLNLHFIEWIIDHLESELDTALNYTCIL